MIACGLRAAGAGSQCAHAALIGRLSGASGRRLSFTVSSQICAASSVQYSATEVCMRQRIKSVLFVSTCLLLLADCTTVAPAPGADKVRVTDKPADVTGCTPVGNIHVPKDPNGLVDAASAGTQFRNEVVGLGGNAGFVTYGFLSAPVEGVAYRCP